MPCINTQTIADTVEPVLEDRPIGHKNVVSQDRWSLVTGSVAMKYRTLCQEYMVFQDRWSLMAVICLYTLYCTLPDIDECEMRDTCEHNCINSPGQFSCGCRQGFELYGETHCAGTSANMTGK